MTSQFSESRIPKVTSKRGKSASPGRSTARYLRDTGSGVISSRGGSLSAHRDDVRNAWRRTAALAMDLIQNSGKLRGAADQVIADTVGVGLTLTPQPDLSDLNYSDEEVTEFIQLVKKRFKAYWTDRKEIDQRGKFNGPQLVDIALRWDMAYGEVTGVFDFFPYHERQRYGIQTGTKLRLYPPTRLVQETDETKNLFQGIFHDENGRATHYRFQTSNSGFQNTIDFPAEDEEGRTQVLHVFDPMDSEDVRGISRLAAGFRQYIQAEMLGDATLQMATLQTLFAMTLTSDQPSHDAFEALELVKEIDIHDDDGNKIGNKYVEDFLTYLRGNLEGARNSKISVGSDPRVSHLAPGEKLSMETVGVPGQDFLPYAASLDRTMARAIGMTYGAFSMDNSDATYSSVRMDNATIWPVVMRRRERIAAPICQMVYEAFLDEEIGSGRIPFKGGYQAFFAHRKKICAASWQGPARPTADDYKSAKASSERLSNGTSSIEIETGDLGVDPDELFEQRHRLHKRYVQEGMKSPYAEEASPAVNIAMEQDL